MARSRLGRIKDRFVQLLIVGLVFGFVPYILFQSACGETNQVKVNDQYSGQKKRFGAPPAPSQEAPRE